MFRLILLSLQIRYTLATNRVIHFLQRIPLVRDGARTSAYGDYATKRGLTAAASLYIAVKRLFWRFFLVAFLVFFSMVLRQVAYSGGVFRGLAGIADFFSQGSFQMNLSFSGHWNGTLPYLLGLWLLNALFSTFRLLSLTKNDEIVLRCLRVNPRTYALAMVTFDHLFNVFMYLPYLLIALAVGGVPLWVALPTSILYVSLRLAGEYLYLAVFSRTKKTRSLVWSIALSCAYIVALVGLAWVRLPAFTADSPYPLAVGVAGLVGACIGAFFAWRMKTYPDYDGFLWVELRHFEEVDQKAQNMRKRTVGEKESVKNWDAKMDKTDLASSKYEDKEGFSYLNAIFFDRHGKLMKNKLYSRCIPVLACGLLAAVLGVGYVVYADSGFLLREGGPRQFFRYSSIFLFIIYCLSMGRVVTASVFSNCDIEMLHYPYYRTRETIFASFKARFAYILRYNLWLTSAMSIAALVGALALYGELDVLFAVVFVILLTGIGAFFSFNDLFLYYVIQPYDEKGKTKSVAYSIINTAVYFFCYINMTQSELFDNFLQYSSYMLTFIVLYIAIGMGLLLKFAPKSFKLR